MIKHVSDRINNRLRELITPRMIRYACHIASIVTSGKYYVELKKYDECIHIDCPENVNGDTLIAVIKNNIVVTIMLAKSWKREYFSDGRYVIK